MTTGSFSAAAEPLADRAREEIRERAGRIRDDELDRPRGIGALCRRERGDEQQHDGQAAAPPSGEPIRHEMSFPGKAAEATERRSACQACRVAAALAAASFSTSPPASPRRVHSRPQYLAVRRARSARHSPRSRRRSESTRIRRRRRPARSRRCSRSSSLPASRRGSRRSSSSRAPGPASTICSPRPTCRRTCRSCARSTRCRDNGWRNTSR